MPEANKEPRLYIAMCRLKNKEDAPWEQVPSLPVFKTYGAAYETIEGRRKAREAYDGRPGHSGYFDYEVFEARPASLGRVLSYNKVVMHYEGGRWVARDGLGGSEAPWPRDFPARALPTPTYIEGETVNFVVGDHIEWARISMVLYGFSGLYYHLEPGTAHKIVVYDEDITGRR